MKRAAAQIGFLCSVLALLFMAVLSRPTISIRGQESSTATPQPLYALPNPSFDSAQTSSSIALRIEDGRTLATANKLSSSVTVFAPALNVTYGEFATGRDPRFVTFSPDGDRLYVTSFMDNTLSRFDTSRLEAIIPLSIISLGGAGASGVVASDTAVYVAAQLSDEVLVIDPQSGHVITRIATPSKPTGLALWGPFLYVTHFDSGALSLIYLPQGRVVQTIPTSADAGLSNGIALDISRGLAYLPQTRLNTSALNVTFDRAVFPLVTVVNLREMLAQPGEQIALTTADRPVSMPFATALDRFSRRLYVANAASDDVSVIDLNTGDSRGTIDAGTNPRGLVLNIDNSRLYVHNVLDNTVSIIDPLGLTVLQVLPVSQLNVTADQLIGITLFYTASDDTISAGSVLACATCHFDGIGDGRIWQGFGRPLTAPLLFGLPETPPYLHDGSWDEMADVEIKIREWQGGRGLITDLLALTDADTIHAGRSAELDALTAYVFSLQPPDNPSPPEAEQVERGAVVFAEQGCTGCHVGAVGTDLTAYDVGTGGEMDTPQLRWLWLSAPYLHDGRAPRLADVFALPGAHQLIFTVSPEDIDALVAYLLSRPAA